MDRVSHQVIQIAANRMISMTVSRPVYSEATSSEAPNNMPGNRNDGAQKIQAATSTARNRDGCMPIMPATEGMMGRNGPMKRPATTLFAPCAWKNRVPRSIRAG